MKYIEELAPGNCFLLKNKHFLLTIDFKSNNKRLCYNLVDGSPLWLDGETIVEDTQIYTMDEKNTIIPIKETQKMEENHVSNI